MDSSGITRNYQLLTVLARRICSLVICLIKHAQQEYGPVQNSLRQTLLPMHRTLTDFLFGPPHASQQSFQLRGSTSSFVSLPSMPQCVKQPSCHHRTTVDRFPSLQRDSITLPEDVTPPLGTPPPSPAASWANTPLGFTSTPLPPTIGRSHQHRYAPFALINQLLTVMRTANDCNLSNVTDRYANDPVFCERILHELDELRSLIVPASGGAPSDGSGQAVRALLDRVEQAEITLSMLMQNLEQLQNH
uniref:Uncharacterized protein n=1 Tax=Anopheles epiroticus TaxID=199890 RepID=A0A182PJJ3_9DIPT